MANKKVLIAEDSSVIQNLTKKILQFQNFEICSVKNGKEVLKELSKGNFDVILMDINMPQMDGWDFLSEFEKLPAHVHQKCRVIMLTSSIDFSDIKRSKTYSSVTDFISKPLTLEKLSALL